MLVIFSKKLTITQKLVKLKIKLLIIVMINILTAENFAAILAQANLASKSDIANFIKKTKFDDKLKNLNKEVASNKAKHVLHENEWSELSKKVKAISTQGFTKDLINKYNILNGAK